MQNKTMFVRFCLMNKAGESNRNALNTRPDYSTIPIFSTPIIETSVAFTLFFVAQY